MANKIKGALSKYNEIKSKAQEDTENRGHYDDSNDVKPQTGRAKTKAKTKVKPKKKPPVKQTSQDEDNEEYAKRIAQEGKVDRGTARSLKRIRENKG